MIGRHVSTLKEAAEACQVNLKTIRRRGDKGEFPNTYRSATRASSPWSIPVTDPIAAGLTPGKPTAEEPAPDRETLLVRVWSIVGAPTMTASRWAQLCKREGSPRFCGWRVVASSHPEGGGSNSLIKGFGRAFWTFSNCSFSVRPVESVDSLNQG